MLHLQKLQVNNAFKQCCLTYYWTMLHWKKKLQIQVFSNIATWQKIKAHNSQPSFPQEHDFQRPQVEVDTFSLLYLLVIK